MCLRVCIWTTGGMANGCNNRTCEARDDVVPDAPHLCVSTHICVGGLQSIDPLSMDQSVGRDNPKIHPPRTKCMPPPQDHMCVHAYDTNTPYLLGVGLDDRRPLRHLPVPHHHHLGALPHTEDRRRVHGEGVQPGAAVAAVIAIVPVARVGTGASAAVQVGPWLLLLRPTAAAATVKVMCVSWCSNSFQTGVGKQRLTRRALMQQRPLCGRVGRPDLRPPMLMPVPA